jgi:hypothetical protein
MAINLVANYLKAGFYTGVCEERKWAGEAEESSLLEAVAKERVLKTQQTGNSLADVVVICELWKLLVALWFVLTNRDSISSQ